MPSYLTVVKYLRAAKLKSDTGKRKKEKTQNQGKEGHSQNPPCRQRVKDLLKDGEKNKVITNKTCSTNPAFL